MLEDINYINNNYYYYNRPQQNQGWNQQRPNYSERRSKTPVIPISIGIMDFPEALCDFGSSINIMPSASKISLYIKGRKNVFLQEQDYTNPRAIPT